MEIKKDSPTKLGLVLSGGGAKGAYEVGVIKAMARLGIEPEVVSGASIGAINGAIVASSPNMQAAAEQLEVIWNGINSDSVLKLDASTKRYCTLAALHLGLRNLLRLNPAFTFAELLSLPALRRIFSDEDKRFISMLTQAPLENILEDAVDFSTLSSKEAKQFYVSIFPASKTGEEPKFWSSVIKYARSNAKSIFKNVNTLSSDEATRLILASAAIPLAFKPVKIGDQWFYDGGMGDRVKVQGNTPAQPVVDEGCSHMIVVMLGNDVLWNRYEWPESTTALEIRPRVDMGGIKETFDFSPDSIQRLINQGEQDALYYLGRTLGSIHRVTTQKKAEVEMAKSVSSLYEDSDEYNDTMDQIAGILAEDE